MQFPVSPGVVSTQIDLTTVIPSVSTTTGVLCGVMRWGPVDQAVEVDSEVTLANTYLPPTNFNAETFFVAADFLTEGKHLLFSRAGDFTGNTVAVSVTGNTSAPVIAGNDHTLVVTNANALQVGMVLFSSNSAALVDQITSTVPPVITSIVNSTAVLLSKDATADVVSLEAIFREDVLYSAVGQEFPEVNIDWDGQIVRNETDYENRDGAFDPSVNYVARYAGTAGNSLRLSQCDSPEQFSSIVPLAPNSSLNAIASVQTATVGSNTISLKIAAADTSNATLVSIANTQATNVHDELAIGDLVQVGNTRVGFQFLKVTAIDAPVLNGGVYTIAVHVNDPVKLGANTTSTSLTRFWEFYNLFDRAPGTSPYVTQFGNSAAKDELHVVVVDELGAFTTSPGSILEVHKAMSRASDAKNSDGSTNYYKNVINQQSKYIWFANDRSQAVSNTAAFITSSTAEAPLELSFYGGGDGLDEANCPLSTLTFAYDRFQNKEDYDISLVLQGKARGENVAYQTTLGNYLIDYLGEGRQDCMVFISPYKDAVVNNARNEAAAIIQARSVMRSSSYGVCDTGYYQRYDKYNDIYRWIPLNGQIAALCVRTDRTNDAWWSPAGFKRGQLKNVVRLAYNPRQADRDNLYKVGVNPVVSFPNQGTILYGDKTMLQAPSAFSRINVQRLFIVLRKAISVAAQQNLFDFNDDFTRAQFRAMVNPYLKDVQGRRGIKDFYVQCDQNNNTPQVVMNNQFIATIFVKPNYSINFIGLQFVAVRDDVSFSQVIGTV